MVALGSFLGGAVGGSTVSIVIRAVDRYSREMKKAGTSVKGLEARTKALNRAMRTGGLIAATVLAAGIAFAVRESIKLENEMVAVRKTTGMVGEELEKLKDGFIDLSKVMPVAVDELAKIGAVAGQLGIRGKRNILEFTRVSAMMAIATELSAEDAALALAKLTNAFELQIIDVENLGNVINELSNTTAASSTEIVDSMRRAAAAAHTLGIEADTIAAMSATLVSMGQMATRSGTRMRSAFTKISQNIDKAAQVVGVSTTKMREKMDTNMTGALFDVLEALNAIESPTKRITKSAEIFGLIGAQAMNGLITNLGELKANMVLANDEIDNGTSLVKEFEAVLTSTQSIWTVLWNDIKDGFIKVGDVITEVANPLIEAKNKTKALEVAEKGLIETLKEEGMERDEIRKKVAEMKAEAGIVRKFVPGAGFVEFFEVENVRKFIEIRVKLEEEIRKENQLTQSQIMKNAAMVIRLREQQAKLDEGDIFDKEKIKELNKEIVELMAEETDVIQANIDKQLGRENAIGEVGFSIDELTNRTRTAMELIEEANLIDGESIRGKLVLKEALDAIKEEYPKVFEEANKRIEQMEREKEKTMGLASELRKLAIEQGKVYGKGFTITGGGRVVTSGEIQAKLEATRRLEGQNIVTKSVSSQNVNININAAGKDGTQLAREIQQALTAAG